MPRVNAIDPFWVSDGGRMTLYQGDSMSVLKELPAKSVHCAITSPPYWGLRDYGTGTWVGGNPECDHVRAEIRTGNLAASAYTTRGGAKKVATIPDIQFQGTCGKCGARRTDSQIGSEPSPDCGTHGQAQCGGCFVCSMVGVFREVFRVLRDDGTCWINLGDSYGGKVGWKSGDNTYSTLGPKRDGLKPTNAVFIKTPKHDKESPQKSDLPSGNLLGIPWRVALALQADGWVLRSAIPWVKRSPLPESCESRPTKAVEDIFLFTKSMDYYFDMEAIKPPGTNWGTRDRSNFKGRRIPGQSPHSGLENADSSDGRNFRNSDLWFQSIKPPHGLCGVGDELIGLDVTSHPYKGAHFSVFPPKLVEPMILAGTSAKGCCAKCGEPWTRITEREQLTRERPNEYVKRTGEEGTGNSCGNQVAGVEVVTKGWQPVCSCNADVVPCTVLDIFCGTNTTGCVSTILGRRSIGIELSEKYLTENAIPRCKEYLIQAIRNEREAKLRGFSLPGTT